MSFKCEILKQSVFLGGNMKSFYRRISFWGWGGCGGKWIAFKQGDVNLGLAKKVLDFSVSVLIEMFKNI